MELGGKIECPICDWDWEVESDDDRPHLCHQCGYDSKLGDFDEEALHQWEEENDYPFSEYIEHSLLDENHEMTMDDFNQVGDVLSNPKKAKQIHQLLVNMFPSHDRNSVVFIGPSILYLSIPCIILLNSA